MAAIAAFAQTPQAKMLATICDRFNVDPGSLFADDVLAFNFRAALMTIPVEAAPVDDWEAAGNAVEKEWLSA
jgi:hypothetical protein